MADEIIKKLEFQTTANTVEVERLRAELAKLTATGKQTKQQMQKGFVSVEAGRALSQFNEKTEKGRQLLTTFGGAMGGAAGQAVYYGGTLSYVVGRFSLLELGVMASVAAITALGLAIYNSTVGPLNDAIDALDKTVKETDKLIQANDGLIERLELTELGITNLGITILKTKRERTDLILDIAKLQDEFRKLEESRALSKDGAFVRGLEFLAGKDSPAARGARFLHDLGSSAGTVAKEVTEAENRLAQLNQQIAELEGRDEETQRKKRRREAGKKKVFLPYSTDIAAMVEADNRALGEIENARQQHLARLDSLERQSQEGIMRLYEENLDRRIHLEKVAAEQRARLAEEDLQRQLDGIDTMKQVTQIAGTLAGAFAKSEEGKMKVKAFMDGILSTLDALREGAKAAAAYASQNYAEGIQHTVAAALFTAHAAMAFSKAGRGGGGGGGDKGAGAASSRTGAQRGRGDREGGTLIINITGPVLGNAGAADFIKERLQEARDREDPGRRRVVVD